MNIIKYSIFIYIYVVFPFVTANVFPQELEIFAVDDFIDPAEWTPIDRNNPDLHDRFFVSIAYGGTVYSEKQGVWYRKINSPDQTLEELYNLNYPRGFTDFFRFSNNFYYKDYQIDWKFTILSSHENQYVNYNNKLQFGWYSYSDYNEDKTERIQFTWNIDSFQRDISNQFGIGFDFEELRETQAGKIIANVIYAYRPGKHAHYLATTSHVISTHSFLNNKLDFSGRIGVGGIGRKWRFRPYRIQLLWEVPVEYISGSIYFSWSSHLWLTFNPTALSSNNEYGVYIGTPIYSELF